MNKLKYSLAAFILGLAASSSSIASPQDSLTRVVSAGQPLRYEVFDPAGRVVKAVYTGGISADRQALTLNEPAYQGTASVGRTGFVKALEELPQSKGFTLLAAVGVILVIARRRLASRKF